MTESITGPGNSEIKEEVILQPRILEEPEILKIIIKYFTAFPVRIQDGLWLKTLKSENGEPVSSIVKGNTLDVLADMIEKGELIVWFHAKNTSYEAVFRHADNSDNSFIRLLKEGETISNVWNMIVRDENLTLEDPPQIPSKKYLEGLRTLEDFLYHAKLLGLKNIVDLAKKLFY